MKKISVIIPFYKANNTVGRVLDALEQQDFEDFDVILVDDSPEDRFKYDLSDWDIDIQYLINEKNRGLAQTLTRGIKNSESEIVVTLHADCVPTTSRWLRNLIDGFNTEDAVGAVTSRVLIDFEGLSAINKIFAYIYDMGFVTTSYEEQLEQVSHVANKADAYNRNALETVNYFSGKFKTSNEDTELSQKLITEGYVLIRNNKAQVRHILNHNERQGSIVSHLKKGHEYSRQTIYLLKDYGVTYKLDALIATAGILLGILIPISSAFAVSLAGMTYLGGKGAVRSVRYMKDQKSLALVLPIIFFSILWEIAAGIGWLEGGLLAAKKKKQQPQVDRLESTSFFA